MSRTDKDAPFSVRLQRGELNFINLRRFHWDERGVSPRMARFYKKEARRARRRSSEHPYQVKSLRVFF